MIPHSVTAINSDPVRIIMDCPVCGCRGVVFHAFDHRERLMVGGVVPAAAHTTTWVVCGACDARFASRDRADRLAGLNANEVARRVRLYRPLADRLLPPLALLLSLAPTAGLILALIAVIRCRKHGGWLAAISWVALGVAILVNAAMFVGMLVYGGS